MKVKIHFISILLLVTAFIQAQNVDLLKDQIQTASPKDKIVLLNNLAEELLNDSLEESLFYSQQASMEALQQNLLFEEARSYYLQGTANAYLGREDFALFYLNKCIEVTQINKYDSLEIVVLLELAIYYVDINLDSSVNYCLRALNRSKEANRKNLELDILTYTGGVYHHKGENDEALQYWEQALTMSEELNDRATEAIIYNNIGVVYRNRGDNQTALSYFQKNLKLQEEIGDSLQIARSLSNIGNIYYFMDIDLDKAMDYYKRGLAIFESIGDHASSAFLYNSIGFVQQKNEEYISAIESFEQGLKIFQDLKDDYGIAFSQNNLGSVYLEEGKYQLALKASFEALELFQKLGDQKMVGPIYNDIAQAYQSSGQFTRSLSYYQKAVQLYEEMETPAELYEVYKSLSTLYEETGNIGMAFEFYKKYSELKDEVISDNYLDQVSELETRYQTEKNQRELAEEKAIVESQKIELLRKNVAIKGIGAGLIIVIVFSALVLNLYRQKKQANLLLEKQNIEIRNQHDQIKIQKKEITDSIEYASRIQNGLLPSHGFLDKHLSDYFVYFKPRDIVSGDFYWFTKVGEKIVIIAADCTGHGVPGAFMSILSISYLNEVINKDRMTKPSDILETLRNYIICTLNKSEDQKIKGNETYDGIDMSIVTYTPSRKVLEFAGAYNPMYLIRDKELIEYKADRMPVGLYPFESKTFTNQKIDIEEGDQIYLFSDGFSDQFGGPDNKKFLSGKFKKLLVKNSSEKLAEQMSLLHKIHTKWKDGIAQIDDILILGIRF